MRAALRARSWRASARKLWERYHEVAELDDQHEITLRLGAFLSSFREAYAAQHPGGEATNQRDIDSLYGDCTDILHNLLAYVDRCLGTDSSRQLPESATRVPRLLELIPEALKAAELIMRDERYAEAIRRSPDTIGRILSIVERLNSRESLRARHSPLAPLATVQSMLSPRPTHTPHTAHSTPCGAPYRRVYGYHSPAAACSLGPSVDSK